MSHSTSTPPGAQLPPQQSRTALRDRLAALRGPAVPAKPLTARALAALAANPGCARRALLDAAGVDKSAVALRLGAPAPFGQSQFAFARGNAFEARVMADGGRELLRLLHEHLDAPGAVPAQAELPDLGAAGPQARAARTLRVLSEATAAGHWTLLGHPLFEVEVAGTPVYVEPDAVAVHPDGSWTVLEIKSFPILDGSADPVKVGAAARQAAVYVLALEASAALCGGPGPRHSVLLVCPKDFSNLPAAQPVDVRKQLAATRRQLVRLTRIEQIAAALPGGTSFDPAGPAAELAEAVDTVPAAYAPDCLAVCELAFHCRGRAKAAGAVTALGRSVRGELGALTTVEQVLAAARGTGGDPADPAAAALRRAAALRGEALREVAVCR